jgi:hypothetical protein
MNRLRVQRNKKQETKKVHGKECRYTVGKGVKRNKNGATKSLQNNRKIIS